MFGDFLSLFHNDVFNKALSIFLSLWPVWLPIITLHLAFKLWMEYIQRLWLQKQGSILLEIKIPKDVPKSPAAMEFVLNGIWENANIGTPADAFWEGKLREWFSLEIVAFKGEVRFFLWAFPRWKKIIETRVYAQYPGAEVVEAEDWAKDVVYDADKFFYSGLNTALVKPDPYPIKTYVDYELDKVTMKEQEEAIDPLTPMIEYLGSFREDEIGVYQIIIRAHADENYLYGRLSKKKDWKGSKQVEDTIKEIIEKQAYIKPEKDKPATMMALTEDQKKAIASIERNAGKLAFDTMMRMFYVAPKGTEDKTRAMGMIGSFRQLGTHHLNGIKPEFPLSFTHTWNDFMEMNKKERTKQFVDAVKRRAYFGTPHHHLFHKPYILSTEEVATIYHPPGATTTTPTLRRAPSKKAEAPANLPL